MISPRGSWPECRKPAQKSAHDPAPTSPTESEGGGGGRKAGGIEEEEKENEAEKEEGQLKRRDFLNHDFFFSQNSFGHDNSCTDESWTYDEREKSGETNRAPSFMTESIEKQV